MTVKKWAKEKVNWINRFLSRDWSLLEEIKREMTRAEIPPKEQIEAKID